MSCPICENSYDDKLHKPYSIICKNENCGQSCCLECINKLSKNCPFCRSEIVNRRFIRDLIPDLQTFKQAYEPPIYTNISRTISDPKNESNSSSLLCKSMRCSKYAMENKTKFYGYCNECFKQNVLKTDEIDPPVADKKDEDKYSDKNLNNQSRNNIHVREHKTVESSEKENHTNITQRISSARQREEINIPVTRNLYDKETIGHSTSDFIQPNRKQVTFFINFIKPLLLTIFCL